MRPFDLTPQIDRLVRAGMPGIQRMTEDVYRKLWPTAVEAPAKHAGRFDRVLCVDAFPLYPMHTAVDRGSRRVTLPVRLVPLPSAAKPMTFAFTDDAAPLDPIEDPRGRGPLVRYVIFWQAGERWKARSPNAMRSRFDADECGLHLNEALHLALQEEALLKARRIPLAAHMDARGETWFAHWEHGRSPSFTPGFGMFAELEGVPSRAKEVIPVSTEDQDFFLKG